MDLDARASAILQRIPFLSEPARGIRRPIYVEFSGTPKAGKTSTLDGLERFLRHNGFSVGRVTEAASQAPIRTKDHYFFNVWTACTTLRRIVEEYDRSDLHFLLIDRGIFDALWWFEWMRLTARITDTEKKAILDFVAMDAWLNLIDVVFLMRATPEQALEREKGEFPTHRTGKIMNPLVLEQLNTCVDRALAGWGSRFRRIVELPTAADRLEINTKVAEESLDAMDAFLDEELWVIPRTAIHELGITPGLTTSPVVLGGLHQALANGHALRRSLAESDPSVIQVIPCGVLRYKDQVLLLRRREADSKHRLNDRYVLWAGGHIRREDVRTGQPVEENCLTRELKEELWIKAEFTYKPICCVYDTTNPRSAQHLALMFEVCIESPAVSVHMQSEFKEFKEGKGKGASGKFFRIDGIDARYVEQMERWSVLLLKDYFGVPVAAQPEQGALFGA
jgi:predicted NUDIX family phosphoesterase